MPAVCRPGLLESERGMEPNPATNVYVNCENANNNENTNHAELTSVTQICK